MQNSKMFYCLPLIDLVNFVTKAVINPHRVPIIIAPNATEKKATNPITIYKSKVLGSGTAELKYTE